MNEMSDRLRHARLHAGFNSARSAAARFGWKTSTYSAHENGQNGFNAEAAADYGKAFKCSPAWLLTGEGEPPPSNPNLRYQTIAGIQTAAQFEADALAMMRGEPEPPRPTMEIPYFLNSGSRPLIDSFDPDAPDDEPTPEDAIAADAARRAARRELRPGEIIERDVRGGMGIGGFADQIVVDGQVADGVRGSWTVPVPFLHTELRAREHEVDIIPVDGDSMLPTLLPGDRVMIHRGAVAPSPDGIFAIDDGVGVSVKRLQIVRGSDPLMIRIMSDNPAHREDIVPADAIKVIGRVILKMSRL